MSVKHLLFHEPNILVGRMPRITFSKLPFVFEVALEMYQNDLTKSKKIICGSSYLTRKNSLHATKTVIYVRNLNFIVQQIFTSSSGVFSEYIMSSGTVRFRPIYRNVNIYLKLLIELTVSAQPIKYASDNSDLHSCEKHLSYISFLLFQCSHHNLL